MTSDIVVCWICGKNVSRENAMVKTTYDLPMGNVTTEYECEKCYSNKDLQKGILIGKARELDMYDNGIFLGKPKGGE